MEWEIQTAGTSTYTTRKLRDSPRLCAAVRKVIKNMTLERFLRFKNCFDAFYLSQEIHLRKPNSEIYNFVLDTHQINPKEILFIDDTKENTESAKKIGIHSWNIIPKKEDIVDLFILKKDLFKLDQETNSKNT